jgi:hypothetical protein
MGGAGTSQKSHRKKEMGYRSAVLLGSHRQRSWGAIEKGGAMEVGWGEREKVGIVKREKERGERVADALYSHFSLQNLTNKNLTCTDKATNQKQNYNSAKIIVK